MEHQRICKACDRRLGKKNQSGYCRAHAPRAMHDDPAYEAAKIARFQASWAASPARAKETVRLAAMSRARMAWCPEPYRAIYHKIRKNEQLRAAEARSVILGFIADDHARKLVRPQLRRAG